MKDNIFILSSAHPIPQVHMTSLENVLSFHAKEAMKDFGLSDVNITVYLTDKDVIPGIGVSGYTPYHNWIQIKIDPTGPDFQKRIEQYLPATIYHEMHHAARWSSVGYGESLTEVIITEGLATIYQQEKWSKVDTPWSVYTDDEIKNFLEIYKKRFNEDAHYGNAAHSKWFFGSTPEIPKWFGYKLGVYFIRKVKKRNPDVTAKSLVNTNAENIVLMSGI